MLQRLVAGRKAGRLTFAMLPMYFSIVDQQVFSCSSLPAFVFFMSTCIHELQTHLTQKTCGLLQFAGFEASLSASGLMTVRDYISAFHNCESRTPEGASNIMETLYAFRAMH